MERNIKIIVGYQGTAYKGWQYQHNLPTVQGCIENAIHKLTGETVNLYAAGRTDAGVHARGQVGNFKIQSNLPVSNIEMGLNFHLPDDISVISAQVVNDDFNARYDAKRRTYRYYFTTERTALMRAFCWQFFQKFDSGSLNILAQILIGKHDFGAFSRVKVESSHKNCQVYESYWVQDKNIWIYHICANRFLHGMVRTIVGTIVDVARGKLSVDQFRNIFKSKDRLAAGPAAPAKGLVLEKVEY